VDKMCSHNFARSEQASPPNEVKFESDAARLAELNLSYAHAIAAEVSRKLPRVVERKEIPAWAELGLVEAAESFDSFRGIHLKPFAHSRIKGAMFDGLRKMGWPSWSQYQRPRFEMSAYEYLFFLMTRPTP